MGERLNLAERYSHLAPRALFRRLRVGSDRRRWPEAFSCDDYDWRAYPNEYQAELAEMQKSYIHHLRPGQYEMRGEKLVQMGSDLPLHPNHRLVYETILQLQPGSVLEAGCGGGMHLRNLNALEPHLELFGLDRSQEQLALFQQAAPALHASARVFDLTMPSSSHLPVADIVFTQAVLMHIHTGNGHLVALANLFRLSKSHLILMENWRRHQFLDDIKRLFDEGMIPWSNLHAYVRRAPELGDKPHLMVISQGPLEYEPLTRYSLLTE